MTLTVFWKVETMSSPYGLYGFLGYARGYNGKDNARRSINERCNVINNITVCKMLMREYLRDFSKRFTSEQIVKTYLKFGLVLLQLGNMEAGIASNRKLAHYG